MKTSLRLAKHSPSSLTLTIAKKKNVLLINEVVDTDIQKARGMWSVKENKSV